MTRRKPVATEQLMLFSETVGTETARCRHCGQYYRASEEPDPCIGRFLPGVEFCCCGHGDVSNAYVDLASAWAAASAASTCKRLTGETALAFFARHGCGPSR